jgi:hypothetical protein
MKHGASSLLFGRSNNLRIIDDGFAAELALLDDLDLNGFTTSPSAKRLIFQ